MHVNYHITMERKLLTDIYQIMDTTTYTYQSQAHTSPKPTRHPTLYQYDIMTLHLYNVPVEIGSTSITDQ